MRWLWRAVLFNLVAVSLKLGYYGDREIIVCAPFGDLIRWLQRPVTYYNGLIWVIRWLLFPVFYQQWVGLAHLLVIRWLLFAVFVKIVWFSAIFFGNWMTSASPLLLQQSGLEARNTTLQRS